MRTFAAQKSALTRALNRRDKDAVVRECRRVKQEWNQTQWPDDWARWQRALDDVFGWPSIDLDSL